MSTTTETPFVTVVVEHQISRKTVLSLLVGLLENNYSPWLLSVEDYELAAGLKREDFKESGSQTIPDDYYTSTQLIATTEGCCVILHVDEPNPSDQEYRVVKVGPDQLKKGIELMAKSHPKLLQEILDESDDANHADIFGQLVVYGEEIFS